MQLFKHCEVNALTSVYFDNPLILWPVHHKIGHLWAPENFIILLLLLTNESFSGIKGESGVLVE